MLLPDTCAVPLPSQPDQLPWPTDKWLTGEPPVHLDDLLDEVMDPEGPTRTTLATAVVHRGRLVAHRYAGRHDAGLDGVVDVDAEHPLISWSMAKSILHAVIGILVGDGRLSTDQPVRYPSWAPEDTRSAITVDHALTMRDGLDFTEEYEGTSDVIDMLFGPGRVDVAAFVGARPLLAEPGTRFNYSSGTTNLLSGLVRDLLGGPDQYRAFLSERLFEPLGMRSAQPTFDDAGTFVASSYVHATAEDFARFGLLYARDGRWEDRQLLPEGWVDHGRRARSIDVDHGRIHGAHWWITGDDLGTFWASGYEGQSTTIVPPLDLVLVRLGKTPIERRPYLDDWKRRVVSRFRTVA